MSLQWYHTFKSLQARKISSIPWSDGWAICSALSSPLATALRWCPGFYLPFRIAAKFTYISLEPISPKSALWNLVSYRYWRAVLCKEFTVFSFGSNVSCESLVPCVCLAFSIGTIGSITFNSNHFSCCNTFRNSGSTEVNGSCMSNWITETQRIWSIII